MDDTILVIEQESIRIENHDVYISWYCMIYILLTYIFIYRNI